MPDDRHAAERRSPLDERDLARDRLRAGEDGDVADRGPRVADEAQEELASVRVAARHAIPIVPDARGDAELDRPCESGDDPLGRVPIHVADDAREEDVATRYVDGEPGAGGLVVGDGREPGEGARWKGEARGRVGRAHGYSVSGFERT